MQRSAIKTSVIEFIQSSVIALGLTFTAFIFLISPNEVEGSSMQPNYYTGDRLYTNKLSHWLGDTTVGEFLHLNYERGDVIVITKPGFEPLIKRLIGLPNERIVLRKGEVYINGQELKESYIDNALKTEGGTYLEEGEEITIPDNHYFVMGDNRRVSNDSRYIGLIKKEWIQGKVFLRIWPLDHFGVV